MKVYAVPEAVPAPQPDYSNFDIAKEIAAEEKHMADLKAHLIAVGYTGKHTGGVVSYPVADGRALYMLADGKGRYGSSFLIHLPYGDAYQYRGVEHFPKKAIIEDIERGKKFAKLFSKA